MNRRSAFLALAVLALVAVPLVIFYRNVGSVPLAVPARAETVASTTMERAEDVKALIQNLGDFSGEEDRRWIQKAFEVLGSRISEPCQVQIRRHPDNTITVSFHRKIEEFHKNPNVVVLYDDTLTGALFDMETGALLGTLAPR